MVAYVQSLGGAAGTVAGTVTSAAAAASTAGNAIVVVATVGSATAQSFTGCTDSKGNTYVEQLSQKHTTASLQSVLYMARNTAALTTSDTITVTHANGANFVQMIALEFSGVGGDADATQAAQSSATGTAYDSGSGTVPAGSHLLLSVVATTGANTATPSGSGTWTALPSTVDPATTIRRGNPFYQVVSGGGPLQNVGTLGASVNWLSNAIAIPAAAAGLLPPTGLTATPVSASQINLSWSAVSGATGYDIERDGAVIVSGQTGTTYSDSGLTASTLYTYRVRSVG